MIVRVLVKRECASLYVREYMLCLCDALKRRTLTSAEPEKELAPVNLPQLGKSLEGRAEA